MRSHETLQNMLFRAFRRLRSVYELYETSSNSIPADALSARTPRKALQVIDLQGFYVFSSILSQGPLSGVHTRCREACVLLDVL